MTSSGPTLGLGLGWSGAGLKTQSFSLPSILGQFCGLKEGKAAGSLYLDVRFTLIPIPSLPPLSTSKLELQGGLCSPLCKCVCVCRTEGDVLVFPFQPRIPPAPPHPHTVILNYYLSLHLPDIHMLSVPGLEFIAVICDGNILLGPDALQGELVNSMNECPLPVLRHSQVNWS